MFVRKGLTEKGIFEYMEIDPERDTSKRKGSEVSTLSKEQPRSQCGWNRVHEGSATGEKDKESPRY